MQEEDSRSMRGWYFPWEVDSSWTERRVVQVSYTFTMGPDQLWGYCDSYLPRCKLLPLSQKTDSEPSSAEVAEISNPCLF